MFDIGFWELVVISIIGLVVLGPERLPTAIRTVRDWISKVRSLSHTVQTEIKEELRIHELHENLKKAEAMNMQDLPPELAESVESLKSAADMVNKPYEKSVSSPNNTAESSMLDENTLKTEATEKPVSTKKDQANHE